MKLRVVAVGCWLATLPLAALVAHKWVLAGGLAIWTLVAMGLADGDA